MAETIRTKILEDALSAYTNKPFHEADWNRDVVAKLPDATPEEKALLDQYQGCVKGNKTRQQCFEEFKALVKGTAGTEVKPVVPPSTSPTDPQPASNEDPQAIAVANRFFEELAAKGVVLSGDPEKDEPLILENWQAFKKAHENDAGTDGAEEAIYRWFGMARWYAAFLPGMASMGEIKISAEQLKQVGAWATALICTAQLIGFGIRGLLSQGIGSDTGILGILKLADLDLDKLNESVAGPFNFKKGILGLTFRIYNNPTLRSALKDIPPDIRPWVQNTITFFTLIPWATSMGIQEDFLSSSPLDPRQAPPLTRGLTEAQALRRVILPILDKLMAPNGDLSMPLAAHRALGEINQHTSIPADVTTLIMRGTVAAFAFHNAQLRSELYVAARANKKGMTFIEDPFTQLGRAVNTADQRISFAAMMNASFLITDQILFTADFILKKAGTHEVTRWITPAAALGLSTLLLHAFVSNPLSNNPNPRGRLAFGPGDRFNTSDPSLEPDAVAKEASGAANDTLIPFFLGALERAVAAYANNPELTGDAFLSLNPMLTRNHDFSVFAAEALDRFEKSGQGDGDYGYYLTKTMGSLGPIEGLIPSLWAGMETGSAAAHAGLPAFVDAYPFITGLIIRFAFLKNAWDNESVAHDKLVTEEWVNLSAYLATAAISFGMTYWLDVSPDTGFDFEFAGGTYKVSISPLGVAIRDVPTRPDTPDASLQQRRLTHSFDQIREKASAKTAELKRLHQKLLDAPRLETAALLETERTLFQELITLEGEACRLNEQLIQNRLEAVDATVDSGIPPIYTASVPLHRELASRFILPSLYANQQSLQRELDQLHTEHRKYRVPPKGLAHITSIRLESAPLSPEYNRKKRDLEGRLADVSRTIQDTENGVNLETTFQQLTGKSLPLLNMRDLIAQYRAELASQKEKMAFAAALRQTGAVDTKG